MGVLCNKGCLDIWRGRSDGAPLMYFVQFWYALGAVVGPLAAARALKDDGGEFKSGFKS